jgi:hypothetical protein
VTNAKPQAASARLADARVAGVPACASEGAATATAPATSTSLATLLASHILRDGELVLLILKPSIWFILLSSLRFIAVALIVIIAAKVFNPQPGPNRSYAELGATVIIGRLMWGMLQWMGRLYILTDMRILSLTGVFNVEVFDCPLRKVARTRLVRGLQDRAVGVGSIEIIPQDESYPFGLWQTVGRPKLVHEQIVATISRAKQGGLSCQ